MRVHQHRWFRDCSRESSGSYQFDDLAINLAVEFKMASKVRRRQLTFYKSIHGATNAMPFTDSKWGITLPSRHEAMPDVFTKARRSQVMSPIRGADEA